MRKIVVSEYELNEIIRLKQSGDSWLRIEGKTGIPRRSAKKAYEEWERSQSMEELKRARTDVAKEEFRSHMDDLVELARYLVDSLYIPHPAGKLDNADEFLEELWKKDIRKEQELYEPYIEEREGRRIIRRNKMLFQSLQEHIREKIGWQSFGEWKTARNSYIGHLKKLKEKIRESIDNILSQNLELKQMIEAANENTDTVSTMSIGVVESLWRAIKIGKPYEEHVFIGVTPNMKKGTELYFGKETSRIFATFPEEELAEEAAKVCRWAATNLCRGKEAGLLLDIENDMTAMQRKAEQLEESLDGLKLRSIILKTRCELCPA